MRHDQDGAGWCLECPWNRPLFSERMGYRRPVFRLFGFRIFHLEPVNQGETIRLLKVT